MTFAHTVGNVRYTFGSLRELLARATPPRSGDVLARVAARSAEERVAAQFALADVPLEHFLSEHVVPYEQDEVTRLIVDTHDAEAFAPIRSFVVADGLSALAVERHAAPLLREWLPRIAHWSFGPVFVVEQGRVAIADEIGAAVRADLSVMVIGERPGLSSPDSLGLYITWQPRPGRTDAERNCISNIHSEGLSYREPADQLMTCVLAARLNRFTGTALDQTKNHLEGGSPAVAR